MPFCPNCRFEYVPEITACPDCGANLVESLPAITELAPDVEWTKLQPLPGMIYAKMVTEVLDERGIPNYIQSLFGSGGLGVVTGGDFAGADARIWVPVTFRDEAQRVQDEMMKDSE